MLRVIIQTLLRPHHFWERPYPWPIDVVLFLLPIQAVSQPYTPSDVEVGSGPSQKVPGILNISYQFQNQGRDFDLPPAMAFKQYPPRQPYLSPPPFELTTVNIVKMPYKESSQERRQSTANHEPHRPQYLLVPRPLHSTNLSLSLRHTLSLPNSVLLLRSLQPRPQRHLHHIHTPQQHYSCENRICVLMKGGILQVVVVKSYEDCKGDEGEGEVEAEESRARVGEGCVAHQAGCVDHGELVNELHWVFEGGVEEEGASPDQ